MRLGIDIDGVLRDFMGQLTKIYKEKYPTHQIKPQTQYELAPSFLIGDEIYKFSFETYANEILGFAQPYDGALEFLDELKNHFDQHVVLISYQPTDLTKIITKGWLIRNKVPYDEFYLAKEKWRVACDLYLDDYTKNLEELKDHGKFAICMDRPWNQDWKDERIFKYEELHRYL